MIIYQTFNIGIFILVASAYIISVTSSRPVSQGKSCEVLVQRNCDSNRVTSFAELYKRVFSFLRFTRADVKLCYRKKTVNCVHGKCGDSRCECFPCWEGESCDVLDNKHVPKFEQPIYDVQIPEDVSVGSTVTVVSAIDHDSKVCEGRTEDCACAEVIYNIENGNENGHFEINSKTGVLSVGKSLATSEKKAFKLAISASNNKDNSGTKSTTKVRILVVQEETGSRKRRSLEVHHRSRRAIISGQSTLIPTFKPVVPNVTYYNVGDEIKFAFNLNHNTSAGTPNPIKTLVVTFNSKDLKPKQNSIVMVAGSVPISGNATYNETSATLQVNDLTSGQALAVEFYAIVKSTIHPLANLYFTVDITGTDSGGGNHYPSGPHLSVPTLYAVFPKVTLQRTSMSDLCVGSVTKYKLTIEMPKLNFSLLVELSTAINDFSFMKIDGVKFVAVGNKINVGVGGGKKQPSPNFYKSKDVDFYDRAVLDFGNLTVSDASSQNKIEIEFNVTIKDHPSLANASKHWVGAGMRSGYQMLWVGQEAISVCKNDPTIVGTFSTSNDTKTKRYFIGDKLYVNWEVAHNNNSYAAAQYVNITFAFKGLTFLSGSYFKPSTNSTPQTLTANADKNATTAISESILAQDAKISGSLELEVSLNISPLKELDIIMTLAFKNAKGDPKDPREYKPSSPFVAGVPIFNLKSNSSSNTIRIGGRAKFFFTVTLLKMVSALKVEVILPVNESSIMTVTSMKVVSVGSNIQNFAALAAKTATFKSTVNDVSQPDRATIDFGTVTSQVGETNGPDNQIKIEFEIIVNDHANVTNGSKHWVGVGVTGGQWMMWIGEVALIADVPADRRPVLFITCTCTAGAMQCQDNTTLTRDNVVEYNATVEHHPNSQGYADNVKVTWMTPPYVRFKTGSASHNADILNVNTKGVPQFEFKKGLKFLDKMSFSFMASLDPEKMMPAGKTAAFSPIQLSYAGQTTSGKFAAPLVPVNFFFTIPGNSSEAQTRTCTPPPELTSYDKAIILDKANNILYICRLTQDSLKSSCFYTSDKGESWKGVNEQVGFIIGLIGNNLYSIARNKCAYLHQAKRDGAWYAVPVSVWNDAKSGAEASVKKLADSYANTADPTGEYQMTAADGTVWGANKKGVYVKPSIGSFTLKALWTCCEN